MKIFLLDRNPNIVNAWEQYFAEEPDVEAVCANFDEFMESHNIECVVSPANAFGLMDGGYDAAITRRFGRQLQQKVQKYIIENFFGEQPVGSSFIIDTGAGNTKLIHTPTMRVPEKIVDPSVIYHCMRSCLIVAMHNKIESIVIPAFGGLTGRVKPETIALMMWLAWNQINNPPQKITWKYADSTNLRKYLK